MTAYYNEHDLYAAQWLRNLIAAGHIAPGVVDTRSIEDVRPSDLAGFTQCHFFAGIGVWSLALRRAGWPDDRRVWTASCPCQPFSAAGEGAAFADERHLWPHLYHLIGQCHPTTVFGEQVASGPAASWLDLVSVDMEALGFAFGALAFPSAGVGAPHIRDRTYWVAHASGAGLEGLADPGATRSRHQRAAFERSGPFDGLADADSAGLQEHRQSGNVHFWKPNGANLGRLDIDSGVSGGVGYANGEHAGRHAGAGDSAQAGAQLWGGGDLPDASGATGGPSPTNGQWRDVDWILCRDGKWRAVEPGTFPLAHGATARVGRLRAYGNAINAEAAVAFIRASGLVDRPVNTAIHSTP